MFLVAVPVMVLLLLLGPVLLPEYRDSSAGRIDPLSVALSLVAVLSTTYAVKHVAEHGPSLFAAAGLTRQAQVSASQPAKSTASTTQWIDGSRAEREDYDDDSDGDSDDRKLSKSERKRLRKLKTRNRAA